MKLNVLLSDGKDKLDTFLTAFKEERYRYNRTNRFDRGQVGRYFGYSLVVVAVVWFVYRLFC